MDPGNIAQNLPNPGLAPIRDRSRATATVGIIGFSILLYDHLLTFDDEVELIWGRPQRLHTYLFLVNRYLTPLGFIVNLWAYLWTGWSSHPGSCERFVPYEGAMTVVGINIVELMMLTRIRSLYRGRKEEVYVVMGLGTIFLVELAVNSWLVSTGGPAGEGNERGSCSMIFTSPGGHPIASSSAWLPLLYDTIVLLLTMYRTLEIRAAAKSRSVWKPRTLTVLLNEGLAYYGVICAVTLVLTIMINTANPDLQNIAAQLELLLSVAMMSRITLDLKKQSRDAVGVIPIVAGAPSRNLGQEMGYRPGRVDTLAPTAPSAEPVQKTRPTVPERIPPLGAQAVLKWPARNGGGPAKWYPAPLSPAEWLSAGSDRGEGSSRSVSTSSSRPSGSRSREDWIEMGGSRSSGQ